MASEYDLNRNPGSVLFVAQQGPEKYFKALLVVTNPVLTDHDLKNKFGHRISALFEACRSIEPKLELYRDQMAILTFGQQVRYQSLRISLQKAVEIIDLAHDLCHTVAMHLLSRHPLERGAEVIIAESGIILTPILRAGKSSLVFVWRSSGTASWPLPSSRPAR